MLSYYKWGGGKKLNQLIFAGSHDAAITGGDSNVQTQNKGILDQAIAGVRLFDLRIAVATVDTKHGSKGTKGAQLKAFHGSPKTSTQSRFVQDLGRIEEVEGGSLKYGDYGMGLTKILREAKKFVTQSAPTEFLILKFDKCTNWELIAEACHEILGDCLYKTPGNLNLRTLDELKGHVIVVFTPKGLKQARKQFNERSGILGVQNLKSDESPTPVYEPEYNGLQYYGKGGTDVSHIFHTKGMKISENIHKQSKLMKKGSAGDPNVMGMMYWTTTGLTHSIKERNDVMWQQSNVVALRKLWSKGLAESIESRLAKNIDPCAYGSGPVLKAFMPNIIMVDFADAEKCKTIDDLNSVASNALTSAMRIAKGVK